MRADNVNNVNGIFAGKNLSPTRACIEPQTSITLISKEWRGIFHREAKIDKGLQDEIAK